MTVTRADGTARPTAADHILLEQWRRLNGRATLNGPQLKQLVAEHLMAQQQLNSHAEPEPEPELVN